MKSENNERAAICIIKTRLFIQILFLTAPAMIWGERK
jgi:hypothetical protein